jgi:hypothetical protein
MLDQEDADVINHLLRDVDGLLQSKQQYLSSGACVDYGDYRFVSGQVTALMRVAEYMRQERKRLYEED